MYGTTLCLPGDFFHASTPTDMVENSLSYVDRLKSTMQRLPAIPTRHHTSRKSFVPPPFSSSDHVFIQHDAAKRSLQPPYEGPFPVLKRTPKHYTIKVHGQQQTVSIDRLKPAFLEDLDSPQLPPTPPTPPLSTPTYTDNLFRPHCPLARQTNTLTLDLSVISCPCCTLGGEYCGGLCETMPMQAHQNVTRCRDGENVSNINTCFETGATLV